MMEIRIIVGLTRPSIHFQFQHSVFCSEQAKVGFIISLLTGPAQAWATAEWSRASPTCSSYQVFSKELIKVFDPSKPDKEAALKLSDIRQGSRSVANYSIEFNAKSFHSQSAKSVLFTIFYKALSEKVKNELTVRELPGRLDGLIDLAIHINRRIREQAKEHSRSHPLSHSSPLRRTFFNNSACSPAMLPPDATFSEPMQT